MNKLEVSRHIWTLIYGGLHQTQTKPALDFLRPKIVDDPDTAGQRLFEYLQKIYGQPSTTSSGKQTANGKPAIVSFQDDMADAINLQPLVGLLLNHLDQFWLDEKVKQRFEIRDFLQQNEYSEYVGLTTPQQNFMRKIINAYNRWAHAQQ